MKILFLYFTINTPTGIHHGLASLSGYLKQCGHQTQLIHITKKPDMDQLWKQIMQISPDIIGISVLENQWSEIKKVCWELKDLKAFIICGGPYATMYPQEVIEAEGVKGVCIGDGEFVMDALTKTKDLTTIHGLITKGTLLKDYTHAFVGDLKRIAPEDYSIFNLNYILHEKNDQLEVTLGRGCIYQCTYCINHSYLQKYTIKPIQYVRIKDPKTVIQEIKSVLKDYPIKRIAFTDDDFLMYATMYPEELKIFYDLYKKEIGLPFTTNDNLNSWVKGYGKDHLKAGGDQIRVGIESSERLRHELLKRPISNLTILQKMKEIKETGIEVSTYNMMGLPFERKEDLDELIHLNAQIIPKWVKIATFFPYYGTPLYDLCVQNGFIDQDRHDHLQNNELESCLIFDVEYLFYLQKFRMVYNWYLNALISKANEKIYLKVYQEVMTMDEKTFTKARIHEWDRELSKRADKSKHYIKRSDSLSELIGGDI